MLEFIRDLYASFRQTSLERVKSPFLGAFVFSWVAFNWQVLAILFFSQNEIEKRISYIDDKYDIGTFLLAPLSTSVLISFLLPQINKLITKIQDKPNSDTIELTLSSKIKVAELQQSIAEIEARKKLADKKEERFIEERIYAIKEENSKLNDQVLSNDIEINELNKKLSESKIEENNYKSLMNLANETRDKAEKNLSKATEANMSLHATIRDLQNTITQSESSLKSSIIQINSLQKENHKLKEITTSISDQITQNINEYPGIFKNHMVDGMPQVVLTDNARRMLPEFNDALIKEILSESFVASRDSSGKYTQIKTDFR